MVPDSLVSYLQLIKLHTPVELIDLEQWDRISSIGLAIPSAATTFFGFECRLGQPDAQADLLLCADASEAGRRVLAANAYSIDLPQELLQHPVWQNVRHFSTNWDSEASILYHQVRNVWLEFDVADAAIDEIPVPSAFFGPEPLFAVSDVSEADHPYAWVWQQALPLLWGRPVAAAIVQNLIRCFAVLPEKAYVFQIGLMLAREWNGVRLCIRDISPTGIVEFLSSLDWQGEIDSLRDRLTDLSEMVDRIDLDIDITDRVLPKIGLECYLRQQPKFEPRWATFLDSLLLQGLCLPQKYQSLLNYPGFIRKRMNPELWPTKLDKLSSLLGASHEWVIFKGLHHIKLVYQDASFKEAKAYLYVSRSLVKGE